MYLNQVQQNPDLMKSINEYLDKMKQDNHKRLFEAHKKAQEEAKKRRKNSNKKIGSVSISNTDTVNRAIQVRGRLYAKLDEIFASDLDSKVKMGLAKDVMMQINKVDQKIHEIKRREKAMQEEQVAKKNETAREKRRRQYDMQKRSTSIRREYLYPAEKGGLNPDDFNANALMEATAVSFDISGVSGDMPSVAVAADVAVEVNV